MYSLIEITMERFHRPCSVKIVAFVRKTSRVDVRIFIEIDRMVEFEDGDIVVESASIKLGMYVNANDISFDIWIKFYVVIDVPFAQSSSQVTSGVSFHAMCSSNDVSRRDQSSTAYVNALGRILFQYGYLPRIFT